MEEDAEGSSKRGRMWDSKARAVVLAVMQSVSAIARSNGDRFEEELLPDGVEG